MLLSLQISRDCQELEPSVGEQLASLLYLEPDSELMVCFLFDSFLGCNIVISRFQKKKKIKLEKEME